MGNYQGNYVACTNIKYADHIKHNQCMYIWLCGSYWGWSSSWIIKDLESKSQQGIGTREYISKISQRL
jgi:hypothetical protein